MTAGVIRCDGELLVSTDGAPLCSGVWTLVPVPEPFSVETLDPAPLAAAFFAGFVLVGVCLIAGTLCKILLSMIR